MTELLSILSSPDFVLGQLVLIAVAASPLLLLAEVLGTRILPRKLRDLFRINSFEIRTPLSLKLIGLPALVLFLAATGISASVAPSLFVLIVLGLVAGLIATAGLDAIRLPGYLLGYMPLDLPLRFGSMALGLEKDFKLAMMGNVLPYVRKESEKGRKMIGSDGFTPSLSVQEVRQFVLPSLTKVMRERRVSKFRISAVGYFWHYMNGASFGITHAILLGSGRGALGLTLTVGFGLLLATVFLLILRFLIPVMKVGKKLPLVVYLAHINVIWVLALIMQTFVPAEADAASLLTVVSRILALQFGT